MEERIENKTGVKHPEPVKKKKGKLQAFYTFLMMGGWILFLVAIVGIAFLIDLLIK
jgi:hypothetical protein